MVRIRTPTASLVHAAQFSLPLWALVLALSVNRLHIPGLLIVVVAVTASLCLRGGAAVLVLGAEQIVVRNLWRTHRIAVADIKTFAPSRCVMIFMLLSRIDPSRFMQCIEVRTRNGRTVRCDATIIGDEVVWRADHIRIQISARSHHVNVPIDSNRQRST